MSEFLRNIVAQFGRKGSTNASSASSSTIANSKCTSAWFTAMSTSLHRPLRIQVRPETKKIPARRFVTRVANRRPYIPYHLSMHTDTLKFSTARSAHPSPASLPAQVATMTFSQNVSREACAVFGRWVLTRGSARLISSVFGRIAFEHVQSKFNAFTATVASPSASVAAYAT